MTFGLNLHPTDDLASYKKVWTDKGSGWETKYKEWIRANLTSTTLETIERQLERTPGKSVPILDGKIIVCRKEGPRTVRKNYSFVLGIENILNEALKRIETKLIQGLTQIVDYNGNHCQGLSVNLGAIFLDGWTPDDVAYYELFKQMEEGAPYFSYVWEKIKHIKEIADSMCGDALAFKLIINPSITPGKFKPFEFPLGEWRASAELKVE